MKKIAVLGGGTVFHVRPHLALSAPAYGATARRINLMVYERFQKELNSYTEKQVSIGTKNYTPDMMVDMYLTKMAGIKTDWQDDQFPDIKNFETNEDISKLVDQLIADPEMKIIFFTVAMCDFSGCVVQDGHASYSGKQTKRVKSDNHDLQIALYPSEKVINKIRKERKDIFLVGCKTTTSATVDEMFEAGLKLLKKASCNLVLVNDLHTKMNMIVTPEQAKYAVSMDREYVLEELVDMTYHRSQLTFTKSEVLEGDLINWNDEHIPTSLRTVVNHCISKGAYRPFLGKTVGHFATRANHFGKSTFITSIRKTDFNQLDKVGMVLVEPMGQDKVLAFGAKPSVGGMSQRIIFNQYPDLDCIVHFHCQKKEDSQVPVRSQREFECGSHECGKNTSDGLKEMEDGIYAVMLDKHGPNIVFNRSMDPNRVVEFIEKNFDLSKQTSELI